MSKVKVIGNKKRILFSFSFFNHFIHFIFISLTKFEPIVIEVHKSPCLPVVVDILLILIHYVDSFRTNLSEGLITP